MKHIEFVKKNVKITEPHFAVIHEHPRITV
jgi:hypothetical protein